MVLETEQRCPGGGYSAHQGPNRYYTNFQQGNTSPYSNIYNNQPHAPFPPHTSTTTAYHHQQSAGFPVGLIRDHHHQYGGNGGGSHYPGGGFVSTPVVKPHTGGYGSPNNNYYGGDYSHGYGHGAYNPHGYGSGGSNYRPTPITYGYQTTSWTRKGVDDDDDEE